MVKITKNKQAIINNSFKKKKNHEWFIYLCPKVIMLVGRIEWTDTVSSQTLSYPYPPKVSHVTIHHIISQPIRLDLINGEKSKVDAVNIISTSNSVFFLVLK